MALIFDLDTLMAGLRPIITETLEGARADIQGDITKYAEDLTYRAAEYGAQAIAGEPGAEKALSYLRDEAFSIAAIVNRREADRLHAALMQGVQVAIRFAIGIAKAAA